MNKLNPFPPDFGLDGINYAIPFWWHPSTPFSNLFQRFYNLFDRTKV